MSASHSEPMGARGWEPDFGCNDEIRSIQSEITSIRNAIWNAWRQGRTVPEQTKIELNQLEAKLDQLRKGAV